MIKKTPRSREEILQGLLQFIIDAGIWMGPIVGLAVPALHAFDAEEENASRAPAPPCAENAHLEPGPPLSRAERRQWRRLVGRLQVAPAREDAMRKPGPQPGRSLHDYPRSFE